MSNKVVEFRAWQFFKVIAHLQDQFKWTSLAHDMFFQQDPKVHKVGVTGFKKEANGMIKDDITLVHENGRWYVADHNRSVVTD